MTIEMDGSDNPAYVENGDQIGKDKTSPIKDKTGKVGEINGNVPEVDITGKMAHDTSCGLFSWKPAWLQKLNTTRWALVVFCWFAAVQGFSINGVNNVNTTSLERRYFLTSTQVSLISSFYDIAAGIFVLPIGYFGRLGHKPRWLAFAALIMALGSFVMTIPQFATGVYITETNVSDTCPAPEEGPCGDEAMSNFLYVFLAGQFLHGIGGTTLYTLGLAYLDENVKMHNSPIYIGIFEAFAALGPALGYLIGGLFLDIYVDFTTTPSDQVSIDTEDPRWVGAWWIGFLFSSAAFVSIAALLSLFGWELPQAAENRKTRVSQCHADGAEEKFARPDFGVKLKDLPACTWLLLKNPTFMFITGAGLLSSMCTAGLATFLPKFIQTQFSVAPSWSALLTGFVIIPSGILGQLCGGLVPGKLKWGVRGTVRFMLVVMLIGTFIVPGFLLKCDPSILAGVTHQYENTSELLDSPALDNVCNTSPIDCNCTTKSQIPVCDGDGVEYFSACYAGCSSSTVAANGTKIYSGCTCSAAPGQTAVAGKCDTNCPLLPVFLVLLFVMVFGVMTCIPPGVVTSMRCVPDQQGAYALALQWVFVRFLATIPGPILYGAIVDQTCIVWQDRCADNDGSCWQYNQSKLGVNFMAINIVLCILICVCYFMAQLFYKAPQQTGTVAVGGATEDSTGVDNPGFGNDEPSPQITKL